MANHSFKPGDPVIFTLTKHSSHPGPRADTIDPSPGGDDYSYVVKKFWVVVAVRENGQLVLRTRRGKERLVAAHDSNLRHPHWWERWFYGHLFPSLTTNQ